ncbi:MAG TPA: SdrD B-like domain-containing protein [Gemmataceae bacterium]|nr:SdrD B-like domain-containing protein [Gemmataceae bacterium]
MPAAVLDLGFVGAEQTANGAILRQSDAFADSSQFQTFVRIQRNGVEQGYNTDARPVQFNELTAGGATHSLQLGSIPVVTINGVDYREFLLSVNQTVRKPFVSLDELRIYVSDSGNLSGYNAKTRQLAGLVPVYDMDGSGDVSVKLNDQLNGTTGPGDAVVLIPDSFFAGATATSYVYLYSKFGDQIHANGSFEEWGVRPPPPPPPPPPPIDTASLSGFVWLDVNNDGIKQDTEAGIAGVVIQLQMWNATTMTYEQIGSATTDATGFYHFDNLQAGVNYALAEETPVGPYVDGIDKIGTQGGTVDNDFFSNIVLTAGQAGLNNNFGELPSGGT